MVDGGSRTPVPAGGGNAGRLPGPAVEIVLFALGAALAAFTILQGIAPHDEGLMLQAGARITSGQWPYRDFWLNYPPGQPLVLAGLQEVFGASLLAWRIVLVAIDGLTAVLAYRLARRHATAPWALAAWLAVAGAMAYPALPGPNPTAVVIVLAALLAARRRPGLGGLLAGLACLFRIEFGVAAIAAVWLTAPPGRRGRATATAVATAVICFLPVVIVARGALWHDTLGFYGIQGLQRLPFPLSFSGPLRPSKLIEFYFPLILVAALVVWLGAMATILRSDPVNAAASMRGGMAERTRARGPAAEAWSLAPLAVVGLGYLLGRADEFHLVPLAVVLPVMLAGAGAGARRAAVRTVVAVALALLVVHGLERRVGQARHPPALAAVPGPAGDGVMTSPGDARSLAALERELSRITRPGEPILVAPPRFDIVHVGDPLLYVITGHPNPTRYDVMQPGLVTTAPVQREMIASLTRTRVVVRWLDPRASLREPNGGSRSSGVHLLDRWLGAHFHLVARFGVYAVLRRDGSDG
jgi:hypothetical protein